MAGAKCPSYAAFHVERVWPGSLELAGCVFHVERADQDAGMFHVEREDGDEGTFHVKRVDHSDGTFHVKQIECMVCAAGGLSGYCEIREEWVVCDVSRGTIPGGTTDKAAVSRSRGMTPARRANSLHLSECPAVWHWPSQDVSRRWVARSEFIGKGHDRWSSDAWDGGFV